jgi:hypothetical protein
MIEMRRMQLSFGDGLIGEEVSEPLTTGSSPSAPRNPISCSKKIQTEPTTTWFASRANWRSHWGGTTEGLPWKP